jgi:hypothetical protein
MFISTIIQSKPPQTVSYILCLPQSVLHSYPRVVLTIVPAACNGSSNEVLEQLRQRSEKAQNRTQIRPDLYLFSNISYTSRLTSPSINIDHERRTVSRYTRPTFHVQAREVLSKNSRFTPKAATQHVDDA